MTQQELIGLIQNPHSVKVQDLNALKELGDRFPYFYQVRALYLKALQLSDDVLFNSELKQTVLYASDKNWLYYYLYPDARLTEATKKSQREEQFSGSYFDLLEVAEAKGGDTRASLKEIAEKLKASRAILQTETAEKNKLEKTNAQEALELKSKQLIKQKKYQEALVILKQLYLINPEKSIYFADQIRFLEIIIENTK